MHGEKRVKLTNLSQTAAKNTNKCAHGTLFMYTESHSDIIITIIVIIINWIHTMPRRLSAPRPVKLSSFAAHRSWTRTRIIKHKSGRKWRTYAGLKPFFFFSENLCPTDAIPGSAGTFYLSFSSRICPCISGEKNIEYTDKGAHCTKLQSASYTVDIKIKSRSHPITGREDLSGRTEV